MKITRKFTLTYQDEFLNIFGPYDRYLKMIKDEFDIRVSVKNNVIKLAGEKTGVEKAMQILTRLVEMVKTLSAREGEGQMLSEEEVIDLIEDVKGTRGRFSHKTQDTSHPSTPSGVFPRSGSAESLTEARRGSRDENPGGAGREPQRGKSQVIVQPRTEGQQRYMETMRDKEIVFSIGPAGTGKTYLAVAQAIQALKSGLVKKIVLARPAVEAGERLGFLPGDYQAKVNPYLRPLYDGLNSFLEYTRLKRLMETEIVEVIPLAYMRGRNLDDAFIILDEAQNTTSDQMKMFLTRMGNRSRIVVTGDITQIDLPPGKTSGLVEVQSLLAQTPGIGFSYLTRTDIVRHPLVQSIVDAYSRMRQPKKHRPYG